MPIQGLVALKTITVFDILGGIERVKARGLEVKQHQIWPFPLKLIILTSVLANFLFVTELHLKARGVEVQQHQIMALFPLKLIILTIDFEPIFCTVTCFTLRH